jgi:hypothetical protein
MLWREDQAMSPLRLILQTMVGGCQLTERNLVILAGHLTVTSTIRAAIFEDIQIDLT